jgi:hypothetical protein
MVDLLLRIAGQKLEVGFSVACETAVFFLDGGASSPHDLVFVPPRFLVSRIEGFVSVMVRTGYL